MELLRAVLTFGLKGNGHLHRAVVTGILRVSKENLFSGLNNVGVYTLLARRYNTCFGFTEPEVLALLARVGRSEQIEAVARRTRRKAAGSQPLGGYGSGTPLRRGGPSASRKQPRNLCDLG